MEGLCAKVDVLSHSYCNSSIPCCIKAAERLDVDPSARDAMIQHIWECGASLIQQVKAWLVDLPAMIRRLWRTTPNYQTNERGQTVGARESKSLGKISKSILALFFSGLILLAFGFFFLNSIKEAVILCDERNISHDSDIRRRGDKVYTIQIFDSTRDITNFEEIDRRQIAWPQQVREDFIPRVDSYSCSESDLEARTDHVKFGRLIEMPGHEWDYWVISDGQIQGKKGPFFEVVTGKFPNIKIQYLVKVHGKRRAPPKSIGPVREALVLEDNIPTIAPLTPAIDVSNTPAFTVDDPGNKGDLEDDRLKKIADVVDVILKSSAIRSKNRSEYSFDSFPIVLRITKGYEFCSFRDNQAYQKDAERVCSILKSARNNIVSKWSEYGINSDEIEMTVSLAGASLR